MGMIGILLGLLEIRNIMIFNLILQTTLTFLSPLRKTASSSAVKLILLAAYTIAGLAADYAVGLATKASMGNSAKAAAAEESIVALWASFTYLQVCGPDTITAFSMEDTKSWARSSFRLMASSSVLLRAVIVLLPKNRLALAVCSLYFAGIVKFVVRVLCFLWGNLTRFKTFTDPFHIGGARGPKRLPTDSVSRLDSFEFFQSFKRVFASLALTPQQCVPSCCYFLNSEAAHAFEVVETELNFAYDVFYTKTLVLVEGLGPIFRWFTVVLELLAFSVWVSVDKHKFRKLDVRVTYTLFLSSLAFELVSFLRVLLSDWSIAILLHRDTYPEDGMIHRFKLVYKLISLKKKFPSSRWSKSVPRYNLIMWCTSKSSTRVEKIMDLFKIKDLVYNWKNMSAARFDEKTRDILFNALKYLAMNMDPHQAPRSRSWARGDWILRVCYRDNPTLSVFIDSRFRESIKFDKFVLLWHVATELCYHAYSSDGLGDRAKELREFSKVISDYMAHLLVQEDTMLSEVAGEAKVTFQHTCDHVVKFLIDGEANMKGLKDKEEKVERACKMIVMADSEEAVDEVVDGYSVLEDARRLSKELEGMKEEGIDTWEVMSVVWVEMMCFAACNCKVSEHVAQLPKGGQLLTIVWLLVAHFGMTIRFQDLN